MSGTAVVAGVLFATLPWARTLSPRAAAIGVSLVAAAAAAIYLVLGRLLRLPSPLARTPAADITRR